MDSRRNHSHPSFSRSRSKHAQPSHHRSMNFFKAVFADDEPDSEAEPKDYDDHSNHDDSGSDSERYHNSPSDPKQSNPNSSEPTPIASSGWDFGVFIKTLATKSESVIDTYKRDLQEFSTGLKAETAVFREVANRAVQELPKAGVSTFDELRTTVLKGTTQIISQGKEALLSLDQEISAAADKSGDGRNVSYNRFYARLKAVQIDKDTYCLEPDDLDDYEKWKFGFVLEEKGEELGKLFEENGAMENIYHKIVPSEIDPETFWYRYFYKVFKLKQAEEVRVSFLKKAIDDEEELSWDVDEDSDGGSGSGKVGESVTVSGNEEKSDKSESEKESSVVEVNKDLVIDGEVSKGSVKVDDNAVKQESLDADSGKVEVEYDVEEITNMTESEKEKDKDENTSVSKESKPAPKLEKEANSKNEDSATKAESGTTTDEDLEWDEIEDEGSNGDKSTTTQKSYDNAELQKRISTAVEDEDLSWDIEDDDDEPVKK